MASDAMFRELKLRTNVKIGHGSEEAIMGSYVDRRLSLHDVAARGEGHYLYAVDENGRMALGPQTGIDHVQNHSSLIPPREQVRVGGELKVSADGVVVSNTQSGHFMLKDQIRTAQEVASYEAAMRAAISEVGMTPGKIINGPGW
ncbi:MAG: hypothetical protein ACRC8S_11755 [Fimbriiglobus sp.]